MLPWVHLSPILNHISVASAIFAQLMAASPHTLQRNAPFPRSKLPYAWGS